MRRRLLLLASLPLAAAPAQVRIAAPPERNGWFLCDAVDAPFAAWAGPLRDGHAAITLLDRRTGRATTRRYGVGAGDAGMSQVHWALTLAGHPEGSVHGVQAAALDPSAATGVIVSDVTLAGQTLGCRFRPRLRFLGLDARRSVTVSEEGGRLVYRSIDLAGRGAAMRDASGVGRDNPPSSRIVGGTAVPGGFRFVRDGYVVTVARAAGGADAGTVTVTRGGRIVGRDRLLASAVPPAG